MLNGKSLINSVLIFYNARKTDWNLFCIYTQGDLFILKRKMHKKGIQKAHIVTGKQAKADKRKSEHRGMIANHPAGAQALLDQRPNPDLHIFFICFQKTNEQRSPFLPHTHAERDFPTWQ